MSQMTQMAAVKPQSPLVFGFTAAICVICDICVSFAFGSSGLSHPGIPGRT
jgi:hypothetical protein